MFDAVCHRRRRAHLPDTPAGGRPELVQEVTVRVEMADRLGEGRDIFAGKHHPLAAVTDDLLHAPGIADDGAHAEARRLQQGATQPFAARWHHEDVEGPRHPAGHRHMARHPQAAFPPWILGDPLDATIPPRADDGHDEIGKIEALQGGLQQDVDALDGPDIRDRAHDEGVGGDSDPITNRGAVLDFHGLGIDAVVDHMTRMTGDSGGDEAVGHGMRLACMRQHPRRKKRHVVAEIEPQGNRRDAAEGDDVGLPAHACRAEDGRGQGAGRKGVDEIGPMRGDDPAHREDRSWIEFLKPAQGHEASVGPSRRCVIGLMGHHQIVAPAEQFIDEQSRRVGEEDLHTDDSLQRGDRAGAVWIAERMAAGKGGAGIVSALRRPLGIPIFPSLRVAARFRPQPLLATMNLLREIKSFAHGFLIGRGIDIRRLRPDRRVLERQIFPWLLSMPMCRRVLFVGCAWYTQHYPRIFAEREFWTFECDPQLARFGGPRHVIDTCARVRDHFAASSLDAVICNGVYGYGLDDAVALDATLRGFAEVLQSGGLLVFGWNNVPGNDPLGLAERDGFPGFRRAVGGPFGGRRYEVPSRNRHTFDILERTERAAAA